MVERIERTYDELWGMLMAFTHEPAHLEWVNRGRADWLESLDLGRSLRILDLGCGNGYLDRELAARGHSVVAVDRVEPVIAEARRHAHAESVTFVASDLRTVVLPEATFDVVLALGLVGLMSPADDLALMRRARSWLVPGGTLLVESDRKLASHETVRSVGPDGAILWHWSSDESTRTNILEPELHRDDGVIVGLRDPIDPSRGDHTGLRRYIYPQEQLARLVLEAGFTVSEIGHFLEFVFPDAERDRYMLRGTHPPESTATDGSGSG